MPDPTAPDFAAHPTYRGLVVDRMPDGRSGLVTSTDSAQATAPSRIVEVAGSPVAALWSNDSDRVLLRASADPASPPLGEVHATWRDGLLRLRVLTPEGLSLSTSRFRRVDSKSAPAALRQTMSAPWAMAAFPGTYRAELRDEHNAPIGWVSVRILPYQGLPRNYAADLPAGLDGPLAAGAVVLLDSEIGAIIAANASPHDELPGGLAP